ncbi:MAG TPA: hypothetical protein VMU06_19660 [Stellaceae bacterium]|nr:hypothetical protein [Stellaceae bacterium]
MANIFDQFDAGGSAGSSRAAASPPPPPPQDDLMEAGAPVYVRGPDGRDINIRGNPQAIQWWRSRQSGAPAPSAPSSAGGNIFDQFDTDAQGRAINPQSAGIMQNLNAGGWRGIASIEGAPVDALTWLGNKIEDFRSVANNRPPQYVTSPYGGSDWFLQHSGYDQVRPTSTAESVAQGAGAGLTSMLFPWTWARALGYTGNIANAWSSIRNMLGEAAASGNPLGNAAIGAAGGATGQVAADAVPEPYKPLANFAGNLIGGGLAVGVPALTGAAVRGTGRITGINNLLAPITTAGQERLAGESIARAAGQPADLLLGRLDEGLNNPAPSAVTGAEGGQILPGSEPTTFQLLGDQGLGQLERTARTNNPAAFIGREGEQNAARIGALKALAPPGSDAAAVGDTLRTKLADLVTQTETAENAAVDSANQIREGLGGTMTDDRYGQLLRTELEAAKAPVKQNERALWSAIDPDSSLIIDPTSTAQTAERIIRDIPQAAKPMQGEEAEVFNLAKTLGAATPFSNFTALRSRLLDAIREERFQNGETPALRRMQMLRQAMDNTIASAGQEAVAGASVPSAPVTAAPGSAMAEPMLGGAPKVGSTVYTPSDRNVQVRYEVVPGDSLIPSHTDDLTPNPAFPAELQPRERARAASEAQIANMAGSLQPERLGGSSTASEGAPVIGPDGVVESGNARTLAILRAYRQGGAQAQAYRNWLEGQGFNVSGIENPVLIRRRISDLSPAERIRFTQEANAVPGLAYSATERAGVDAGRITPSMLDLYRGGDIASAENRDFVRAFMQSVPERTELGSLVTADGMLSVEGQARIRNALLSKAYGDSNLVGSLAESGDPNIKAFGGALNSAAGDVAKLNAEIAAGRVPKQFDLAAPLVQAAQIVQRARSSRIPLADLVAQQDAFAKISPVAEQLLRDAYGADFRGRLSQAKFSDYLRFYAEEAGRQSTGTQLFANEVTPADILAAGARRYGRNYTEASPSLLSSEGPGAAGEGGGAAGNARGGFGSSASSAEATGGRTGASGLQQASVLPKEELAPNFTAENAAAYREAARATRERAQTWNTGPVGNVLASGKAGLPYKVADSAVAAKFFNAGSHSYEDVQAFLKAAGGRPEAVAALQDYAVSSLRYAAERDGVLVPSKVESWLRAHSDALRAFPDLQERIEQAATAQIAAEEAGAAGREAVLKIQKSAARDFLDGVPPSEAVARLFGKVNAPSKFAALKVEMADNPDAFAGLQRAVADYIAEKFTGTRLVGNSEVPNIRSASFQNFVKAERPSLRVVFGEDGVKRIEAIVADLQRADRSISGTKLAGGSNTAQDMIGAIRRLAAGVGDKPWLQYLVAEGVGQAFERAAEAGAGTHGFTGLLLNGAGVGATLLVNHFRSAGLKTIDQLVSEAMVNPAVARDLVAKAASAGEREAIAQRMIRTLGRQSIPAAVTARGNAQEQQESEDIR